MSSFALELAATRIAQEAWARVSVRDRLRFVRDLRARIVARLDDICQTVHADIARPAVEVIGSELLPTTAALKFLERRAVQLLAPKPLSWWDRPTWLMGCRDVIHRRPWGTVGIIGTWNYPIYLNIVSIAQALVAGNAVLWKPSENAPRTAALTQALFLAAGFPAGLLGVLPATREAGPLLAETDVNYVLFTGSDAVGRKLAARLGERLIPSTLELSGCDAMFVLADADIEIAAKAAWFGLTLNRGQTCIAVRRIFLHNNVFSAFIAAIKPLLERAEPMNLVTPGQQAQAERMVAEATHRGATVLRASPLAPTLLLHTPPDAAICREASFAPLAAVIPFDTIDAAIAMAQQSPFGLAASIFSSNVTQAKELAARIPAGSVVINDVLVPTAHPATPFGGRGSSGWGVTQGAEGLLAMTVPQVVTVRQGRFRPHLDDAVNPDPATPDILRGLLTWTHARGLSAKLQGLWQMMRGVWKKGIATRHQETAT